MQAVILAAGKGTRMLPLTQTTPKPMLLVSGMPILARILEVLPSEITEVLIIVGYLSEQIEQYFGTTYNGRSLRYIQQAEPKGTYAALELAKPFITALHRFRASPLFFVDRRHAETSGQELLQVLEIGLVLGVGDRPGLAELLVVGDVVL